MGFHRTVLTLALIVFLIMITFMAIVVRNSYRSGIYPPEISKCPDYWEVQENGCKATNKNKGKKATGYITTDDDDFKFSDDTLTGRIDKCNWSRTNEVSWDGISNRNIC